jgi:hypothetical protein
MIFKGKFLIFVDELHCVSENTLRTCEACIEAGGQHFSKLNCRGKIDKICGFQCDKAAMFRDMIKWTHCT